MEDCDVNKRIIQNIVKHMMLLLSTIITCGNLWAAQYSFHVKNSVVINNENDILTKLVIILPLAQTNEYQIVNNVSINNGVTVDIEHSDDKYIRWGFNGNTPSRGTSKEICYDFDIQLRSVKFDFKQVTELYSYDTSSNIWKWYTGASGVYVDPANPEIKQTADSIESRSADIVDYAWRCYLYVAGHYSYLNPYTGIHPLQEILDAGGGDCGNLSSIYVSLLRYRKIPSRHIVTVRPDGSYHVWADFYLEKYGWIPVDVTNKNADPSGDYFGTCDGNGIVMTKGVGFKLDRGDGTTYNADILQNYHWWYWCSTSGNGVFSYHHITSTSIVVHCLERTPARDSSDEQNEISAGFSHDGWQRSAWLFNLNGQVMKRRCILKQLYAKNTPQGVYISSLSRDGEVINKRIVVK